MRIIVAMIVIVFAFLIFNSESYSTPDSILIAAEKGLHRFVEQIPRDELFLCGFPKDFEPAQLTLGKPYQLYYLDHKILLSSNNSNSSISPATRFYVPVIYDREHVSFIIIDYFRDEWTAVSIGSAELSRDVNNILTKLNVHQESEISILRDYEIKCDFLMVRSGRDVGFYPLISARIHLEIDQDEISESLINFEKLKAIVKSGS